MKSFYSALLAGALFNCMTTKAMGIEVRSKLWVEHENQVGCTILSEKEFGEEEFNDEAEENAESIVKVVSFARPVSSNFITTVCSLKLTGLILYQAGLTNLPQECTQLQQLEVLDISNNNLRIIPEVTFGMKNLKKLYLRNVQLEELSEALSQLEQLEVLDVSNNTLQTLPLFVCNMTGLKQLYLESNELTELPDELSRLQELAIFLVAKNKLTKFPASFCTLNNIVGYSIDRGPLTLPSCLIPHCGGIKVLQDKLRILYNVLQTYAVNYKSRTTEQQAQFRAQLPELITQERIAHGEKEGSLIVSNYISRDDAAVHGYLLSYAPVVKEVVQ